MVELGAKFKAQKSDMIQEEKREDTVTHLDIQIDELQHDISNECLTIKGKKSNLIYFVATASNSKPFKTRSVVSLVKLHYFQFAFLENCVYKINKKKSIKDLRNFCSNAFF